MNLASLQLFGAAHLWALALIPIVSLILVLTVRVVGNPAVARVVAFTLAGLLILNTAVTYGARLTSGRFDVSRWLPMHLCDWATIAAILALLFRWQLSYELAYFWSLGGTLQALLTPDIVDDFPTIWFLVFFFGHGTVIVSVIFLTLALGMRPWPQSLLRAFLWSNVYLLCAALVNYLFDANYGYLREKPQRASLLDYLGPWPIYIAGVRSSPLSCFSFSTRHSSLRTPSASVAEDSSAAARTNYCCSGPPRRHQKVIRLGDDRIPVISYELPTRSVAAPVSR